MSDTYKIDVSEMQMYSVTVEAEDFQDAIDKFYNGMHSETFNHETVDMQVEALQNLDAKDRAEQFMQTLEYKS